MDGMKYDKVVEMNQKIGKQNARIVEKEILYEAIRKQNQCYKNNLTSMCTQQEIEEKMIKQQKQILQLELEKRKLLEENQRLREVCGILGKEKRENEIRQNSRY